MRRRHFLAAAGGGATVLAGLVPPPAEAADFDQPRDTRRLRWSSRREERINLCIMERYIENLTSGNGAANAQFKSPDMTVTTPDPLPYGGTIPDAEYGPQLFRYWSPLPPTSEPELFSARDRVFLLGNFAATGVATGIEIDAPLVEAFTLVDRLIVNDTIYFFDLTRVLDAVG